MLKCVRSVILSVFVIISVGFAQYEEGDLCETSAGAAGVCKFLTHCQSAIEDIKKGTFPKDICGFEGTQSIVCCVESSPTPQPPPKPTPVVTRKPVTTSTTSPVIHQNLGTLPGEKATEMCKRYSIYAYEKTISQSLSLTSTFSTRLECPISTQQLIVGGVKAARREFPHMVQIGYTTGSETTWDCGGSLISPNFVLTAAHCIRSSSKGDAKLARAGITNQSDTAYVQQRNIIDRIKHPDYKLQKYNDIALFKLETGFDLNTFLRPACLYTQKSISYTRPTATGWGLVEFAASEGSQDLMKVTLEFFTTAKCNNTYRRKINQPNSELSRGIDEEIMICAGSSEDIKDTCQGDSGGPLQLVHPNTNEVKCMYDIIGVTSFGIACGLATNIPGVYTRVSHYIKWIEDIVWAE